MIPLLRIAVGDERNYAYKFHLGNAGNYETSEFE